MTGFDAAIHATFPQTEIQNCIIHQLRSFSKYVSYKDLKALMADLKAVYAAVDEQAALDALDAFGVRWDKKYPKISQSWRVNWANLSTYFKHPQEVRRLDTVDNSQINVLSQRTMHRICTAATNEEVSFAYRVAIPRQRFRWRNAFSTRWRSL